MTTTTILISMLIGYLFGCIQSAYLIGKLVGKLDIRNQGSGNAGASNITSTLGVKYGVIVGLVDILKGMFAVLVVKWLYPDLPTLAFLSGLMAVIGHIFPFYMRFRGGKGVAALVGMMLGVDWVLGMIFILLVAVPALITDYIVAGSFTTFVALPIVAYVQGHPFWILVICLVLTVLCFYLHRANIRRIRAGEELKIRATVFKKI
jgi:glycerol-3-phosphate acyltransferase PlsY